MGHVTYKVFNLYFSIRCGTYNSHLHTTRECVYIIYENQRWVYKLIMYLAYILV